MAQPYLKFPPMLCLDIARSEQRDRQNRPFQVTQSRMGTAGGDPEGGTENDLETMRAERERERVRESESARSWLPIVLSVVYGVD